MSVTSPTESSLWVSVRHTLSVAKNAGRVPTNISHGKTDVLISNLFVIFFWLPSEEYWLSTHVCLKFYYYFYYNLKFIHESHDCFLSEWSNLGIMLKWITIMLLRLCLRENIGFEKKITAFYLYKSLIWVGLSRI